MNMLRGLFNLFLNESSHGLFRSAPEGRGWQYVIIISLSPHGSVLSSQRKCWQLVATSQGRSGVPSVRECHAPVPGVGEHTCHHHPGPSVCLNVCVWGEREGIYMWGASLLWRPHGCLFQHVVYCPFLWFGAFLCKSLLTCMSMVNKYFKMSYSCNWSNKK
jgi:hypothetical protein